MGVVDSDGDGKEDTLELVGIWWRGVAIFVGRLRVGAAAPVAGVNLQVARMHETGLCRLSNVAY